MRSDQSESSWYQNQEDASDSSIFLSLLLVSVVSSASGSLKISVKEKSDDPKTEIKSLNPENDSV